MFVLLWTTPTYPVQLEPKCLGPIAESMLQGCWITQTLNIICMRSPNGHLVCAVTGLVMSAAGVNDT